MTPEHHTEIKASIERAHTEIGEVCAQGARNRFWMSIPAQPDRDTDLIISDALTGAEALLAEVVRLTALLAAVEKIPPISHACGRGHVVAYVPYQSLRTALGSPADGLGVS